MRWDEMRWYEISLSDSTNDIYCLKIYWTRYQDGFTALYCAADDGHIEVMRLLLERGADINSQNKVSDMIWDIPMVDCAIDCVIMSDDSNLIVKSTCQHRY